MIINYNTTFFLYNIIEQHLQSSKIMKNYSKWSFKFMFFLELIYHTIKRYSPHYFSPNIHYTPLLTLCSNILVPTPSLLVIFLPILRWIISPRKCMAAVAFQWRSLPNRKPCHNRQIPTAPHCKSTPICRCVPCSP